jgi:hypothetical protein
MPVITLRYERIKFEHVAMCDIILTRPYEAANILHEGTKRVWRQPINVTRYFMRCRNRRRAQIQSK